MLGGIVFIKISILWKRVVVDSIFDMEIVVLLVKKSKDGNVKVENGDVKVEDVFLEQKKVK